MTTLASSDFNGTASGNIVNDFPTVWNNITGESGGCNQNDTVPGRGDFTPTGADTGIRYVGTITGGSWPNDQYAQAKVWVVSTSGGTGPGVVVRSSAVADTYYRLVVSHAASNNCVLTAI